MSKITPPLLNKRPFVNRARYLSVRTLDYGQTTLYQMGKVCEEFPASTKLKVLKGHERDRLMTLLISMMLSALYELQHIVYIIFLASN